MLLVVLLACCSLCLCLAFPVASPCPFPAWQTDSILCWLPPSLQTVLMDQTRFLELQLELEQLLLVGTVLLVTFSAAGPALIDVPGFAEKIKTVVKVLLTGMHLP